MTYRRGADYEREVRKLFEAAGYSVLRGAGSKGEVFGMKADLVATKGDKTAVMVIIQCKRRRPADPGK
jgi:Holliday junction resolvase